jgi:hypothetical protein
VRADRVDLHDVGVLQRRHRFRFVLEAVEVGRRGVATGQDHLERNHPVQPEVARLVDDAHAAAAQLAEHLVARHHRGGLVRSVGGRRGRRAGGRARPLENLVEEPDANQIALQFQPQSFGEVCFAGVRRGVAG